MQVWTSGKQRQFGVDVPVWRIQRGNVPAGGLPLMDGYSLITEVPVLALDPSSGSIQFSKEGNFREYMAFGWADSDGDWTTGVGDTAVLRFQPLTAPADVEIAIEVFPVLVLPTRDSQRLRVLFNGRRIGNFRVKENGEVRATIPAAWWNEGPRATLQFQFPEAQSPLSLQLSGDPRRLALGFRRIGFRLIDR